MPETSTNPENALTRRVCLALLGIAILALTLRVGAIVALKSWENPNAMEHAVIAQNLVEGRGYSFTGFRLFQKTSVQSPTMPFLLAASYKVFGVDSERAYGAVMMLNALIGAAGVPLVFLLARRLGATACVGMLAALGYAVWPTQIYSASATQVIVIVTVLVLVVVYLFYRSLDTGKLGPWIAFSLLGCFAALTEPALLPPMALTGLLIFVWPCGFSFGKRLRNAAVLLGAAFVVLGPWTLRNYQVHDTFMPVKSSFWVNTWKGNNPYATGTDRLALTDAQREALAEQSLLDADGLARDTNFDEYRQYSMLTDAQMAELNGKPEAEREEVFKKYAQTWIGEHPAGYAKLSGIRLVKTLWLEWDNPRSQNLIYKATRTAFLALTLIGIVLALRSKWRLGFPLLIVGLPVVLITLTITAARFIIPYEPIGLCLIGLVIATCWRAITGKAKDDQPATETQPHNSTSPQPHA
ncbi:glycosyltransferase family 39 protein [Phycisphaeraceae bacterium D3-23]